MGELGPSPPLRGKGQGEGGAGATSAGVALAPPPSCLPPRKGEGAIVTSERSESAAKRLRQSPTFAETLLWKALRKLTVAGSHFRPQTPIGPYVVDFTCHAARLVIEVDGGIHKLTELRDVERDAWLTVQGYRVMRIPNEAVVRDIDGVLAQISTVVGAGSPTPSPSPQGGGG